MSDFGSGHDLVVCEFKPHMGLRAAIAEPALDPLSPFFLSAPPLLTHSLSKINKNKKNKGTIMKWAFSSTVGCLRLVGKAGRRRDFPEEQQG